jgi:hypothetical protein
MNDLKEKVYRTELRFRDKIQKNRIKMIAKQNGRSVNAEILQAIDNHIKSAR